MNGRWPGWASKKRPAVRLLTAGLYYINAAVTSALVLKGTKSLSGIASAPKATDLDLEPLGKPHVSVLCRTVYFVYELARGPGLVVYKQCADFIVNVADVTNFTIIANVATVPPPMVAGLSSCTKICWGAAASFSGRAATIVNCLRWWRIPLVASLSPSLSLSHSLALSALAVNGLPK